MGGGGGDEGKKAHDDWNQRFIAQFYLTLRWSSHLG